MSVGLMAPPWSWTEHDSIDMPRDFGRSSACPRGNYSLSRIGDTKVSGIIKVQTLEWVSRKVV